MELGSQIKKYRNETQLTQDGLAERIFVSRQTISNWENDKSYPDVKSLTLLSTLFNVSIDTLVKGDIKEMKRQISEGDFRQFQNDSVIFSILLIATIILPIPMLYWAGLVGFGIWGLVFIICMVYATRVEKQKKQFNIQTYKEILAFTEGTNLDEIEMAREEGKRPYQKVALAILSALITLIIAQIFIFILK